jgi:subtilisin family serine protease
VLAVVVLGAASMVGPVPTARAQPTPPAVADEMPVPEPPAELVEAPSEEAPVDDGTDTVAAVVVEDGERSVVTVEAAPSEVADVTEELAEEPGVVDVFVDAPARAAAFPRPDDPRLTQQWSYRELARDYIGWDGVSAGVTETVAVLDSGVDATHPDLAGRVLCDRGADFTNLPEDGPIVSTGDGCTDALGHGTHVAGIIGARWDNGEGVVGVSRAQILPVRVLDGQGFGSVAAVSAGIFYAVDQGARVINLSVVGDGEPGASGYEEAVEYALAHDVVVVASAGNNRRQGNLPQYPAAVPGVFSVAATDHLGLSAPYSHQGPTNFISAPGTSILSTGPRGGYESYSGTSMAAPHVAGIVAWYRDMHEAATVDYIRTLIRTTAIDMEHPGKDDSTGYGMIDFAEMVTGVQRTNGHRYRETVPGAPLVTSVVPRDSGLLVAWQPPAWDGGFPLQGYGVHVWRHTTGGYELVTTAETFSPTARSLIVPDLTNGQAYAVMVFAYGKYMAEGQWSVDTPPVRILAAPRAPGIGRPTVASAAARVRWSAPSDDGGSPITGYVVKVYRGWTLAQTLHAPATARSLRIGGLQNGRAVNFLVQATNAVGTSLHSKRSIKVTPMGKPGAPRIGRPTPRNNAARVWWAPPRDNGGSPIRSYVIRVYQGNRGITSVRVRGHLTNAMVTGLGNRQYYKMTVSAVTARGEGPRSPRSPTVRTR